MKAKLIMTIKDMQDHDKWLKTRNLGIGGSDAGAIMGMNPWKGPYELWLEKTGQVIPEDISGKESVYWGTVLEETVAEEFARRAEKRVRRAGMMQNNENPWMLANVDRLVIGEKAGLECKTTNAFSVKEWEADSLPDSYYWQCQHYMLVTGLPVWYIAVLIGGNHFDFKAIPKNDDDVKALYDAENEFWNKNVKERIMPEIDGSKSTKQAIDYMHPESKDESKIDLTSDADEYIQMIAGYKSQEKEMKSKITEYENKLKLMIGDNETGFTNSHRITWKSQSGRITLDSKKIKEELPDVYEKYKKVGKPIRELNIYDLK